MSAFRPTRSPTSRSPTKTPATGRVRAKLAAGVFISPSRLRRTCSAAGCCSSAARAGSARAWSRRPWPCWPRNRGSGCCCLRRRPGRHLRLLREAPGRLPAGGRLSRAVGHGHGHRGVAPGVPPAEPPGADPGTGRSAGQGLRLRGDRRPRGEGDPHHREDLLGGAGGARRPGAVGPRRRRRRRHRPHRGQLGARRPSTSLSPSGPSRRRRAGWTGCCPIRRSPPSTW